VKCEIGVSEVLSKLAFAAHRGVKPSAVTNWITRGRLKPPALLEGGKIDIELADQQLAAKIERTRASSAKRRVTAKPKRSARAKREIPPRAPVRDPALVAQEAAQARLLEARALSAMVDAERKRRELEAERGRYMTTADAEAAWAKVMSTFLMQVEQSLPDLAVTFGLDAAGRVVLRKWWRQQRLQFAEHCRKVAAASPEFVEDPVA
jgi:hypothetical protein